MLDSEQKAQPRQRNSFGSNFGSQMYLQHYKRGNGWYGGEISPYSMLNISPFAAVFHYGQAVFEGMKAYKNTNGRVFLFRPEENLKRFNKSALRMAMPQVEIQKHLEAIVDLVRVQKNEIPTGPDGSLYIRPTMIATEESLNVGSSSSYCHFIITSPVTSYFGSDAIDVYVSEEHYRAVPGGVGNIKTAGNYAASYFVSEQAKALGCQQVLWLDPQSKKNIEEVGAMNIFFVYKEGKIVTPALSGSILPGITRDSIIKLASSLGFEVEQQTLSIDEVVQGIKNGSIIEVFGSGTAAAVTFIKGIHYKGERVSIAEQSGYEKANKIKEALTNIQYGNADDSFNWRVEI